MAKNSTKSLYSSTVIVLRACTSGVEGKDRLRINSNSNPDSPAELLVLTSKLKSFFTCFRLLKKDYSSLSAPLGTHLIYRHQLRVVPYVK